MKRRRYLWLAAAVLLLVVSAWLLRGSEPPANKPERTVNFPNRMRPEELDRLKERRAALALVVAAAATPPTAAPQGPPPPRDPVLVALAQPESSWTVVLEANAITQSPVGQLLIGCLGHNGHVFEEMKKDTGIDPLKDIDRIAVSDQTIMLSGHFQNATWTKAFAGSSPQRYGGNGVVFGHPPRGEGDEEPSIDEQAGVWKDQLLVFGKSPETVRAALDRLDGRAPIKDAPLRDSDAYGEVYGALGPGAFTELLKGVDDTLANRIKQVAQRVELHVDAMQDVAIVARVTGSDRDQLMDLGKSIGAALSLARLKAQAEGQKDLVEFLDLARVVPEGSSFRVELALPLPLIEQHLASCRKAPEDASGIASVPPLPADSDTSETEAEDEASVADDEGADDE